jgi:homoserine O-acetyltransferase/O-succinyltransferase
MDMLTIRQLVISGLLACMAAVFAEPSLLVAQAADYPTPKQADWIVHDFKFHNGAVLPELRLHYMTIGNPAGQPVLILHGTNGSAKSMLTPSYAGELFGPGQPLDTTKYFIILPDAIGHGQSSKPSDGLRMKFPSYDYADQITATYRLLTEQLGIHHLRLVTGQSMGGMETWLWGEKYPDFMDALMPMASQPTPMASRNWMLRRLLIDLIESDPGWNGGNYTTQPRTLHAASVLFSTATVGGTLAYQKAAPTREKADQIVAQRLAAPFAADANDTVYEYESAADYDPSPDLERITAPLLAINSADDERNPPETGITERAMKRVKNGHLYLIPASEETRGHATTGMAKFYSRQLRELLETAPQRAM